MTLPFKGPVGKSVITTKLPADYKSFDACNNSFHHTSTPLEKSTKDI
jgi:hypothetical protein